ALWMGVPVVALDGPMHVSRVGSSLLAAAGLGDLVAATPQRYVEIATGLARDAARRAELRRTMRDRMAHSPLMDAAAYTRNLEAAYRAMWRAWCAGTPAH